MMKLKKNFYKTSINLEIFLINKMKFQNILIMKLKIFGEFDINMS